MKATTEHLIIRPMAETDLPDLLDYRTRPETLRYLPMPPFSKEKAVEFLGRQSSDALRNEGYEAYIAFAIELISEARMIGEVGIYIAAPEKSEGDIGWMLHPDYQGHGYATEAARVLLSYAFEERRLHRVTSGCDTRNDASFRLMERLGMRREAHFRQSQCLQGIWRDEYRYALLRDEWLAANTQ